MQHTHHLVWFAALLAVSPCDEALAPGASGDGYGPRYGVPLVIAWLLLVCLLFFPGLHKLLSQGPGWAGEHLLRTVHWKWAQAWDFHPFTRIDRTPRLLQAGGLGVLALQIGSPLLLWNRWTRAFLAVGALGFHSATALWLDVHFWHLAPLWVALLPFPSSAGPRRPLQKRSLLGLGLLLGAMLTGATRTTQAWPFACYPTFDRPVAAWMPTLVLVAVHADGSEVVVDERALADPERSQAFYARAWVVSGLYGPREPSSARAFLEDVRHRPAVREALAGAVRVRLHAAQVLTDPERRRLHVGEELAELRL